MRLPFVHSGVVDVIIAALQAGGFLQNAEDADAIRAVTAQMDETERDALASNLNYGGAGGSSDRIASKTNVWALVDTDDDGTKPYLNSFSVVRGQSGTTTIPPQKLLFKVGRIVPLPPTDINTLPVFASIGGDLFSVAADPATDIFVPAILQIGFVKYDHGTKVEPLISIGRGADVNIAVIDTTKEGAGLRINGRLRVDLHADTKVTFRNAEGNEIRGGFFNLNTAATFGVGVDLNSFPNSHAIAIEKPADNSLRIRSTDTATERTIYVMGSQGPSASDKRVRFCVGGIPGYNDQDPNLPIQIGGGYGGNPGVNTEHTVSTLIVGPHRSNTAFACSFQVLSKSNTIPLNAHLVNFHSNVNVNDLTPNNERRKLFSITAYQGTERTIIFEARGDGSCYAKAWKTTGLDVAEEFVCVEDSTQYSPGTVMLAQPEGSVHSSVDYCDPRVVGVVSTSPGMSLGDRGAGADKTKVVMLAISGTVPVNVTTAYGAIEVGDLLVSGAGGCAAKAPDPIPPGTVLGKALEALAQPDDDPVLGTIKMLVLNR